ncbi:MAG: hypothetical protein J7621_16515 [Niastella sp.]|nr:hypothetical protein [Niastella sp.]
MGEIFGGGGAQPTTLPQAPLDLVVGFDKLSLTVSAAFDPSTGSFNLVVGFDKLSLTVSAASTLRQAPLDLVVGFDKLSLTVSAASTLRQAQGDNKDFG